MRSGAVICGCLLSGALGCAFAGIALLDTDLVDAAVFRVAAVSGWLGRDRMGGEQRVEHAPGDFFGESPGFRLRRRLSCACLACPLAELFGAPALSGHYAVEVDRDASETHQIAQLECFHFAAC